LQAIAKQSPQIYKVPKQKNRLLIPLSIIAGLLIYCWIKILLTGPCWDTATLFGAWTFWCIGFFGCKKFQNDNHRNRTLSFVSDLWYFKFDT